MKRILLGFFGAVFASVSFTNAVGVSVPSMESDSNLEEISDSKGDVKGFYDYVAIINDYLWLVLLLAVSGVVIYGGITLVSSQGDESKMKKVNALVVNALIGIVLVLGAYSIVVIFTELF